METLIQDLRFALRSFLKKPALIIVAVLMLGLGIGANTALFSVVDALLLKKLPVKEPDRLVLFEWQSGKDFRTTGMRGTFVSGYIPEDKRGASMFQPLIAEKLMRQGVQAESPMSDVFTFADIGELTVVADRQADLAKGQVVSGGYFAGLGLTPAAGRFLTPADDTPGASPAAVLSHKYWTERFNADPGLIGKEIVVNKVAFTVVGVTPQGFDGTLQIGQTVEITIPVSKLAQVEPDGGAFDKPGKPAYWWLHVMGRLKPGATREQARTFLNQNFQETALSLLPEPRQADQPKTIAPAHYPVLVAKQGSRGMLEMRHRYSPVVYLLFGVVGIVLLIACANVANLLLARAAERGPELTVRLAVGAGRFRILRQLVTESLLLAFFGGLVGVLFAFWGKGILAGYGRGSGALLPSDIEYSLNWRVLGFTFLTMGLTGFFFGIVPAFRASRLDLASTLKEKNRSNHGRSRLTKALVVGQVALSLILLFGAGLTLRTVRNLQKTDLGFDQENLLLFSLRPEAGGYKEDRLVQLYEGIMARANTLPGVKSATFSRIPLVAHYAWNTSLILPGETAQAAGDRSTNLQMVHENYFDTLRIPLVRGRAFTAADTKSSGRVAIISESLAKKYFPNTDPLGKRIGLEDDTVGKVEIIGIARDVKYNSQKDDDGVLTYTPWRQRIDELGDAFFTIRTDGDPMSLVPAIRSTVRELDATLPVIDIKTQAVQLEETMMEDRIFAQLLSFFGLLALLLSALGLYGVLAYSVTQRTSEIGIRMALGAQAHTILKLILWQGMKLVLIGLFIGAGGAFFVKRLIEDRLYGVTAGDPLTFAAVGAILATTAALACLLPARRAAQADPMTALRHE